MTSIEDYRHHHRHHYRPALLVRIKYRWHWRQRLYRLNPNRKVVIMTDVVVGHQIVNTIVYLDQNGQPMLTSPSPDAAPVWSNLAAPTVDTMQVSADGTTDTVTAVGAGADSLSVSVTVGGQVFTAVEQINVSTAPQVLSAVAINPVVS